MLLAPAIHQTGGATGVAVGVVIRRGIGSYTAVFYCMGCLEYSQLLKQHPALAAKTLECDDAEVAAAQASGCASTQFVRF